MLTPERNEDGTINEQEFPVAVTLRFRTKKDRDEFMGGLSDGWGENYCDLMWADYTEFDSADTFAVPWVWDPDAEDADAGEVTP